MRIGTIILVVITILLTIILMQNTGTVVFTLLFFDVKVSKLLVLAGFSVVAFILGYIVGRPKRNRYNIGAYHDELHKDDPDTLSDEDRDYIN